MKGLTLTQPWASLVAMGAKRIETRGWRTGYRGPVAIHAAKGFPGWAKRQCFLPPFASFIAGQDLSPDNLPRGRVLCFLNLENCIPTEAIGSGSMLTSNERAFGDYSPGRFAWFFGPVLHVFNPGIYARGSLGLWNWAASSADFGQLKSEASPQSADNREAR